MILQHALWQDSARRERSRSALRLIASLFVGFTFECAQAADNDDKTPPLPNDLAEVARKYAGVTEWQGFFEATTSGSSVKTNGNFAQSRQFEARSHGSFVLKRSDDGWDPKQGNFSWGAGPREEVGEATGSEVDRWSQRDTSRGTSTEWSSELSGTVPLAGVHFDINLRGRSVNVYLGVIPEIKRLKRTQTGKATVELSSANGQRQLGTQPLDSVTLKGLEMPHIRTGFAVDAEYRSREWDVVRTGPGLLAFTYQRTDTPDADNRANEPVRTHRSRIFLVPVHDDLELEVTIEGYANWRPEGSIAKPQEPGNQLVARATLKSKTGKLKTLPKVTRYTFHLLDTSREPGICLNWPLNAMDQDYDLRLAAESGGALSDSDQTLIVSESLQDEKQQPYAEAKIASFDFGAKGLLQVTCELEDGRELMGLIKEGGEQELVRLPKMAAPGWIAEAWRQKNKAEKLADNDDEEKVEGQKDHGDGFTLYEEYRGWVVNGQHVSGDPARKDFFVLNLIGADAKNGIGLFEALSKLRVHSQLRRSEMSQAARLMNGNHREAPHRVDQHGVWVKTFTKAELGDIGAHTVMNKAGVAGRPGIAKGIGLLARGNAESLFNQPFNLPARDTILTYDRAIAHELMHSVGVEHHGRGDSTLSAKWVSSRHPWNKSGRPYFRPMVFNTDGRLTLLDEQGNDLAVQLMGKYSEERAKVEAAYSEKFAEQGRAYVKATVGQVEPSFSSGEAYAEYLKEEAVGYAFYSVQVGEPHGEHSGDQACLMRYYFAEFYPQRGKDDVYYQVTPGTERIGIDICHAGTGTGINAPGHKPHSRYGNAAVGEGNCFSQICPNDAIPPRKTK